MLPAQLGGLHAGLMLAQHANDLILGQSASPHHSSPSDELTYQWHDFWGAGHGQSAFEQKASKADLQPSFANASIVSSRVGGSSLNTC